MSQADAQKRADRIRAFREELRALESEGVLVLPQDQKERVERHHAETLRTFALSFDIDTTEEQKQMSWGMRIASFLGALALCASVYLFFYRFWGLLGTGTQVALVVGAPVLAALLTQVAARREKTMYFAAIVGLIAFGCFVLNLVVLGTVFNIVPSPNAFLPWAAFAFVLAYTFGLRILLAAGILSLAGWLSATTGTWSGCYWLSFGERPENFFPAALVFLLIPLVPHRAYRDFPPIYRTFGLLGVFLPILVLANWGASSYLRIENQHIEAIYQIVGFVVSGIGVWLGIRGRLREVTNLSCTFCVIYLYTKFFDWWWDWMPKYLFFFILGSIAVGLLLLLKRLRGVSMRHAT
jgi:MFS family permease